MLAWLIYDSMCRQSNEKYTNRKCNIDIETQKGLVKLLC